MKTKIDCNCPECNSKLNLTENITSTGEPKHGDTTICSYCGNLLEFQIKGNNKMELIKAKEWKQQILRYQIKNNVLITPLQRFYNKLKNNFRK